ALVRAMELWTIVGRPNLLIKIPATMAGLPAITSVIAEGISVNVTLIFSVERHRLVMDAYRAGLEAAKEAGHDVSKIHSVASFFVSRVDTEIDKRLEKIGSDEAVALRGKAGGAHTPLGSAVRRVVGASREGGRRQCPPGLCGLRRGVRRRLALRAPEGRRRAGPAAAVGVD